MNAPDSTKTQVIRQIAADPQAASFAQVLIMYANLRDSFRNVPVSTGPNDLKMGDPEAQRQTDLFRTFAHDKCGIAADLLK